MKDPGIFSKGRSFFTGKRWQGDLLALAVGAAIPWAFAPYTLFPLAILAPALLFMSWRGTTPGRAAWRGWLFGMSMFGIGVSWIHISMDNFGGLGLPLSVFLTALFVAFLALFPASIGYIATRWFGADPTRGRWLMPLLVLPTLWTFAEWIRGLIFTGFPWLNLGYSQIDTPLAGFAPLLGVYGLSWLAVLTAGTLVYLMENRIAALRLALPVLLVIWTGGALLKQAQWTRPAGNEFKVSLIQGNISQDIKWLREQREPTLKLYADLSRAHWDSRLVIWPETAVPAFYHQTKPFLRELAQEARVNGSELLIGLPVLERSEGRYYNAMMATGLTEGFYFKQHLVPFGEYLPLGSVLGPFIDFLDIPMSDFSPGRTDQPLLTVAGYKVGISICFEDAFGEEVARTLPQAAFLVNASNDAWFGNSLAPHQHLQIARMRSLETGRYMLRSTNTGVSAIIDPSGELLATSPQFKTDVLTGLVQPRSGATPYVRFGNTPLILAIVIVLAVAWRLRCIANR